MAITLVSSTTGVASSASSCSVTIPDTAAGELVVVAAVINPDTTSYSGSLIDVTVTLGGTAMTGAVSYANDGYVGGGVWYTADVSAGETAVEVATSISGGAEIAVVAYVFAGASANPVDQGAAAWTNSSTSWTSGTCPPLSQPSEVAVGVAGGPFGGTGATMTGPGSPWVNTSTLQIGGTLKNIAMAGYAIVNSTDPLTYDGTCTGSGNNGAALITFKAATTSGTLSLVNQTNIADTGGYAPQPANIASNAGNALVAILAVGADNVSGVLPRTTVSDDAHNWWTLAGSAYTNYPTASRRIDVWVCPLAGAVNNLSVGTSSIYAGLCGTVLELGNFPAFAQVDFSAPVNNYGTSVTVYGQATQSDYLFTAIGLAGSGVAQTVTYPSNSTFDQQPVPVSSGVIATDMSDQQLFVAFGSNAVTSGNQDAAWSWSNDANFEGILIGLSALPAPPVQPNPNFPAVKTEAAFGWNPNTQTGAVQPWTDISSYVIDDQGNATLSSVRGRDYELTQPEAGSFSILLNNQAGTFNPVSNRFGSSYAGQVGAFLDPGSMQVSTWSEALSQWTGMGLAAPKVTRYYLADSTYTYDSNMQEMVASGTKICLTIRPAYNPVSPTELAELETLMQTLKSAGAEVNVTLWHEPYYEGLTIPQYQEMVAYYGPTVREYYPLYFVTSVQSVMNDNENLYYPGDAWVDGCATDFYCYDYTNDGYTLDVAAQPALSALPPKPFGIWEFGTSTDPVVGQSQADTQAYFNYIASWLQSQAAAGYTNGDVLWFNAGEYNLLGLGNSENAGFEGGLGTWAGNNYDATCSATTTDPHTGSYSCVIEPTTTGTNGGITYGQGGANGAPVTAGTAYTISSWWLAATAANDVQDGVNWYEGSTYLSSESPAAIEDSTVNYTQLAATVTAPTSANYAQLYLQVVSPTAGDNHYLDDVIFAAQTVDATVMGFNFGSALSSDWRIGMYSTLTSVVSGLTYPPDIVPEVPVRAHAVWNGRILGLGFSYANGWPQTFPHPQWGFVTYTGKDAIGIISQGSMPSAFLGEVLADYASTYYALGEYYENGHGLLFANSSYYNQTPMVGWSPQGLPITSTATGATSDYVLTTGQELDILGDNNSGIGISTIASSDTALVAGGGAFAHDNTLPQFMYSENPYGISLECWTTGADTNAQGNGSVVSLLSLYGRAWNYLSGSSGTSLGNGQMVGIWTAPAVAATSTTASYTTWYLTAAQRKVESSSAGSQSIIIPYNTAAGTGSGTWIVPANTTSVKVECWGGGAGGAGGTPGNGGDGGGGGAYATSTLTVAAGQSYTYNVGPGGLGGTGGGGENGGSTEFTGTGGTVSAEAGIGSKGGTTGTGTIHDGGNGGSPTADAGGGGGSSGGTSGAGGKGGNASGNNGGARGAAYGAGAGGAGASKGNTGSNAPTTPAFPAGGGGGGGGANAPGGNGGDGAIRLTWTPTVTLTTNEYVSTSATSTPADTYHVVLTIQQPSSGGEVYFQLWVNDSLIINTGGTPPTEMSNIAYDTIAVGPVPIWGSPQLVNNYAVGQVAVYPWVLPSQRVASHYNVGLYARQNKNGDYTWQRVPALFQWSQLGVPFGISSGYTPNPLEGDADQIAGTALADALYSLAIGNGGMFYCPATANGEVWYETRFSLYNNSTSVILGDNPEPIFNENPNYDTLQGWTIWYGSATDAPDSTVPGNNSATITADGTNWQTYARYAAPVIAGNGYEVTGWVQAVSSATDSDYFHMALDWYDANGDYISTTASIGASATPGSWILLSAAGDAPSGAVTVEYGPTLATTSSSDNLTEGVQFKAGQTWLIPWSSEIPYDPGSGFDYDDTYIYNIVSSQRTVSTGEEYYTQPGVPGAEQQQYTSDGVNAITADLLSETQYFPRGPLSQPVETATDEDAYDRANWSLAKYRQPVLRANEVKVDLASNPTAIDQALSIEQGDIVLVNRRPAGAPMISIACIVQKVQVDMGPDVFSVTLTLSPYFPENAVLQADNTSFNTLGSVALPW